MRHIGFGLEKIGLAALAWPRRVAAIVILVTAAALFGITQLNFDDDVVYAFRSNSETYEQFRQLLEDRDGASNDVVIMAESVSPLDAEALKLLREMHFELEFADGVGAVYSAFALRDPGANGEPGPPLFPDEFGDADLTEIYSRADNHPLAFSRAVSADRTAMTFVISESLDQRDPSIERRFVVGLDQIAGQFSTDEITVSVLGMQKTRFEIADAILRDQIVFNAGGSIVSVLVAFLVFRNLRLTVLVLSAGSVALIWTLGAAGLAGQTITVVTNIIPVLIIVISFTNSMHLVHSLRERHHRREDNPRAAISETVTRIGPACALTALTTAAAFASLSLTGYGALTELAWFGAAAALISFLAIITVFPLVALLVLRNQDIGTYQRKPGRSAALLSKLADIVGPARIPVIAIAIVLLAAGTAGHLTTTPRFSTYDNIPRGNPVLEASLRAEDKFGGLFNLWIRIPGDGRQMMTSEEGWKKITAVHEAAESVLGTNAVFSPLTIARAAGTPEKPLDVETLEDLPPEALARIASPQSGFLSLSVLVGDPARSGKHQALYDALDRAVRDAGATVVTGTPALARHDAVRMINRMNASIIAAAFATVFLVAFAFRSLSMLPAIGLANLTPVLLTGLILHLFAGGETKIATGLAMTIAFGVAVDDTIHFINRAFLERNAGCDAAQSIRGAITGVGFVLCATTVVLGAGISLTFMSNFKTVRLFGELMVMILFFALLADLIILPAVMHAYQRWHRKGFRQ